MIKIQEYSLTTCGMIFNSIEYCIVHFWGRVLSFNQSESTEQYFLASDRLNFGNLAQKYRTLNSIQTEDLQLYVELHIRSVSGIQET